MYKVICRITSEFGTREIVVREVSDLREAQRIVEILNEGARSNPRSNAYFFISE